MNKRIAKNMDINTIPKNHEDEIFKEFMFNKNYAVSNYGNVWSFLNNIFLKYDMKKDKRDYGYCRYNIDGKTFYKHRIVAIHFIENPNNLPEVNHIDSNRTNCKWDNLEWIDRGGNVKHAIYKNDHSYERALKRARLAGMKNAKKVLCINDNNIFESISDAATFYGFKNVANVSYVCNGKWKSATCGDGKKRTFKFIEGDDIE